MIPLAQDDEGLGCMRGFSALHVYVQYFGYGCNG